jgi:translation initiation factor RLI1
MVIKRIPVIDFNKCNPERCHWGIGIVGDACPHKYSFKRSLMIFECTMHQCV